MESKVVRGSDLPSFAYTWSSNLQKESDIPPSNKRLTKTLKFIKAAALLQVINDIKFALLHGIKNSFVIGITEATFGLH